MAGTGKKYGEKRGRFASVYYPEKGYSSSNIVVGTYKGYEIWRSKTVIKGKVTRKEFYMFNPRGKQIDTRFKTLAEAKRRVDAIIGTKKTMTPRKKEMMRRR